MTSNLWEFGLYAVAAFSVFGVGVAVGAGLIERDYYRTLKSFAKQGFFVVDGMIYRVDQAEITPRDKGPTP